MSKNNPVEFFQSFMNQENLAKSMKWMPNTDMIPIVINNSINGSNFYG